jgi:hypothetical protein
MGQLKQGSQDVMLLNSPGQHAVCLPAAQLLMRRQLAESGTVQHLQLMVATCAAQLCQGCLIYQVSIP